MCVVIPGLLYLNSRPFRTSSGPFHFLIIMSHKLLEVCLDSIESGIQAAVGGAERIELCAALSEGGLTPNIGTFVQLKRKISPYGTKVFVMLRPRRGADFNYSEDETLSILEDVKDFKSRGADGFVFGALSSPQEIDVPNCKRIVEAADPLPVTFHRAFDCLQGDPESHIKTIIQLGFKRLLTSGQRPTALVGLENIAAWNKKFGQDIIIMPGSGVNQENLGQIMDQSGCQEFHSSCTAKGEKTLNSIIGDLEKPLVTDQEKVKALSSILKE